MSAPLAAGGVNKICIKCGMDVAGRPRMKDKDGRYWCIPCGEAEQIHQISTDAGLCEMCGESFSKSQLMEISGQNLCPRCRKLKFSRSGSSTGHSILGTLKSLFK